MRELEPGRKEEREEGTKDRTRKEQWRGEGGRGDHRVEEGRRKATGRKGGEMRERERTEDRGKADVLVGPQSSEAKGGKREEGRVSELEQKTARGRDRLYRSRDDYDQPVRPVGNRYDKRGRWQERGGRREYGEERGRGGFETGQKQTKDRIKEERTRKGGEKEERAETREGPAGRHGNGAEVERKATDRERSQDKGGEASGKVTKPSESKEIESELNGKSEKITARVERPSSGKSDRDVPRTDHQPSSRQRGAKGDPRRWQEREREREGRPRTREKRVVPTVQSDELAQELSTGRYECMVCCDRVRACDQIWSCAICFHVFHLKCIKKWATSPAAAVTEYTAEDGWQCPGCRNPSKVVPSVYKCYCGKVTNPLPKSRGELTVPHSCGDLCMKNLATTPESTCKHKCRLPCHPGPCPPCPAMVTRDCPCGRKVFTVRCSKTWDLPSCGATCGKALACGKHRCPEACHKGSCSSCDVLLTLDCHCGQTKKEKLCGDTTEETFSCGEICNRTLDCGNHLCERPCHKGACPSCPLLPAHVTSCPCGATPISELLPEEVERLSCLDPVPTCGKTCGKLLPCSNPSSPHHCESVCHEGECPSCEKTSEVSCRCGRESVSVPCVDVAGSVELRCKNVCNKKRNCSRHRCNARCCVESEHVCELVCGRKLQCGGHYCQERCHSGRCDQCWDYSYEELSCHCGAEVILPPITCGTRPPLCTRPCARMHPCQHTVMHTCHSDPECPPCTFLTEKTCMGGHELRRNIPCHISNVSCGNHCGKPLLCAMHKCVRICHKDICLEKPEDCKQPCTEKRKFCDHDCGNPCHVGQTCPDTPCKAQIVVECKCGRRKQKALCLASGSGAIHQTFQKLLSVDLGAKIRQLQSGQSVSLSSVTVSGTGLARDRVLECDEVCAQEERNRRVAAALEIESPVISPLVNHEPQYSSYLLEQARKELPFVSSVESSLKALVEATQKSPSSVQSRAHSFPVMKSSHRRVIHELAAFYGGESVSYDLEPHRSVVVSVKRSRAQIPTVTLTRVVDRERYKPVPAPVDVMAVSNRTTKRDTGGGEEGGMEKLSNSPVPDYFADDLKI